MYIGFHYHEILVLTGGTALVDGNDLPAFVGNGTYIGGYPQTDLKTSSETVGDLTQIQAQIERKGTHYGVKPLGIPMPRTIKLENDAYQCPTLTHHCKCFKTY
ncbi:hypothetical protein HYC85_017690 [Camellia sinensis]|uniref:Uncharacterized protein n=1 Tax=Camellia sinensis TaxID=4442 RepID=A0A7J7GS53_CAMSI|nr:hypothetical protein HYC85_017690 [Camellia sinensis]